MKSKQIVALLALLFLCTFTRAQSPVDAGQLLEQQRRLEQQQAPAPTPRDPLLPSGAAPAPNESSGATRVTVRQFTLQGNTLLADAPLQAVLQPWSNRPLSFAELRQAAAAVEQAYRQAGWLAHVSLPAQDLTDGTLRLQITEARMGQVRLATNTAPPRLAARVEAMLGHQLATGQPLNLDGLERVLLLTDDIPGVTVGGSLQAGTAPGSTDVLVQIARTPVLQGDAGIDNAANRSTGSERLNANLRLDSPWGWGEQLGLTASQTLGTSYLRGSASLPVGLAGWRVGLNASALRYRVLDRYNSTPGLAPKGHSETVALEANYPLVRSPRARWSATVSVEQKRQLNEDDNVTPDVLAATSRTRSRAINAGIAGYAFDNLGRGGQTQASALLVAGKLDLDGSPPSHLLGDALTENTQGSYQILRWSASRVQTLTPSLSLAASAMGQFASRNLDSNEKLYLGGMGAVNAYPSGEGGGSSGQLLNLELRQQFGPRWQAGVFYDWGQVHQYQDNARADGNGALVANNSVTLKGAGVSLTWRSAGGAYVKATYAHRIGSNPLATPAGTDTDGSLHKNRVWLSAGISF